MAGRCDTLRFGEFLTQMFGTAADRWRLTFDIGRAFGALLGRRPAVLDRLRRGGCREGEAHEYGRDQGAQRQYLQTCGRNLI